MEIKDVLRYHSTRVSTGGHRWLIIEEDTGYFVVYEHCPYKQKTIEIYRGTDENAACELLIEE